jgi:hypothetical protein
VKEKQQNKYVWELLQDCGKSIPGEASWENTVCKAVKAKGDYFEEAQLYLDLFNTFFGYYMIPCVIS